MIKRLRELKELECSDRVAHRLTEVSVRTINEKLKHQKEVLRQLQKKGQSKQKFLLLRIRLKPEGFILLNGERFILIVIKGLLIELVFS